MSGKLYLVPNTLDFGVAAHAEGASGQLHATALTPATRVDLRLDHPHRAAQLLRRFQRLLHIECRVAAGHWHVELAQDFLALVFVNLHVGLFVSSGRKRRSGLFSRCGRRVHRRDRWAILRHFVGARLTKPTWVVQPHRLAMAHQGVAAVELEGELIGGASGVDDVAGKGLDDGRGQHIGQFGEVGWIF